MQKTKKNRKTFCLKTFMVYGMYLYSELTTYMYTYSILLASELIYKIYSYFCHTLTYANNTVINT